MNVLSNEQESDFGISVSKYQATMSVDLRSKLKRERVEERETYRVGLAVYK